MDDKSVSAGAYKPNVLLVDDEELILSSLRRLLRTQGYTIHCATSGEEALNIMAQHPIDLVMSDARMPHMDGSTLLARIHALYPGTMRLLLTGYADLDMIVKAINEGGIHRYISKPWNDEDMLLTLRQSLAHQHSERERQRLEQLTHDQNEALQLLNATLEKRVLARTSEVQQTADMLDLAYDELKHSYATSTELFSLLVNQRLPADKQTNRQIIDLVRTYCQVHGLDEVSRRDLCMAAALHNIGKLAWTDNMIGAPADQLSHTERERYRDYPKQSEALLMTLDPMRDAARLILHHQERWDGTGFPDRLKGEAIPFGSRLLKLAVDFIELQHGLIIQRRMNSDEALVFIRQYSGRWYDPGLLEGFIKACAVYRSDITLGDPLVKAMKPRELSAGMVLARNLNADNGMLLLNAGKVLSELLVEKLIAFEEMEGATYTVFIRLPEPVLSPAKITLPA